MNCQKETAEIIIEKEADYLLCVKDNHPNLKKDIEDFVQDEMIQIQWNPYQKLKRITEELKQEQHMLVLKSNGLGKGRNGKIFAVSALFILSLNQKKGKSNEWHYYISSRPLTADELLHHARMEWAVESMH